MNWLYLDKTCLMVGYVISNAHSTTGCWPGLRHTLPEVQPRGPNVTRPTARTFQDTYAEAAHKLPSKSE